MSKFVAIFRLDGERSERRLYSETEAEMDRKVQALAHQGVLRTGSKVPVYTTGARSMRARARWSYDIVA